MSSAILPALLLVVAGQAPPSKYSASKTTWPAESARGISGLARAGQRYLAVPERERVLVPFEVTERGVSRMPTIPLIGVPDDLDVESLAVIDGGLIALGTEARLTERVRDRILIASIGKQGAKVESELSFDYAPYGMRAEANRGVEGLCFADGRLVAAAEQVIVEKGARFTPVQSYDFKEKRWAQYRLHLTSETGKISGLSCTKTERAREVFAIERHYSVSRILRFTLPLLDTGGVIEPELAVDLTEIYPGDTPNFEGIERLDDGRLLLISDNDHGGVKGPTHLVLVTVPPRPAPKIKPGAYVQ